MKGFRFYEEFKSRSDKRKGAAAAGTVVAVAVANGLSGLGQFDVIAGAYGRPNSPVTGTTATPLFLRHMCKRVSEARAREIHPNLFAFLEFTARIIRENEGK